MTRFRRLRDHVTAWGPLAWVTLAWLLGPLPGGPRGATGQPTGVVWWWHLAAGVVVLHWVLRGRARGVAGVPLADRVWARGRRWLTVVVVGWVVLGTVAAAQVVAGTSTIGPAVTFLAAAAVVAVGAGRSVGGEAVGRLAAAGVVLAVVAVGRFLAAAGDLDGVAGYYTVKEQVVAPGAAHNVLGGLLLVGAVAVAVQSVRSPRWRWALPLVGLGLGATLTRAGLIAGAIGVVAAWVVVRDGTLARRLGVVVATATVVVTAVLVTYGAELPPDASGRTSVAARVDLWDAAIEVAADAPLVGVGADGIRDTPQVQAMAFRHEHAHNLLLHAAATTGLVGVAATVAVWGGLLVGAFAAVDRDRRNLVVVGLLALGAHAMVDELAFRPVTVGLLALLTMVVAAPRDPHTGTWAQRARR